MTVMKVNFANESLKNEKKVREINMKKKKWKMERKKANSISLHPFSNKYECAFSFPV